MIVLLETSSGEESESESEDESELDESSELSSSFLEGSAAGFAA